MRYSEIMKKRNKMSKSKKLLFIVLLSFFSFIGYYMGLNHNNFINGINIVMEYINEQTK